MWFFCSAWRRKFSWSIIWKLSFSSWHVLAAHAVLWKKLQTCLMIAVWPHCSFFFTLFRSDWTAEWVLSLWTFPVTPPFAEGAACHVSLLETEAALSLLPSWLYLLSSVVLLIFKSWLPGSWLFLVSKVPLCVLFWRLWESTPSFGNSEPGRWLLWLEVLPSTWESH